MSDTSDTKIDGLGPSLARLMMGDEAFERAKRKADLQRWVVTSVTLAVLALMWAIVGCLVILMFRLVK